MMFPPMTLPAQLHGSRPYPFLRLAAPVVLPSRAYRSFMSLRTGRCGRLSNQYAGASIPMDGGICMELMEFG